jgi:hypothetical protein
MLSLKLLVAIVTSALALALPAAAAARVAELGTELVEQTASCPDNCQAIGQVSGVQEQVGKRKNPYRVRSYGKVVAFTMKLGKPKADQASFFTKLFGGPSQAMIVILKPDPKMKGKYILAGQGPLFDLEPYFGTEPTFALPRPLTMKPGYIAALTVPTWAPAFAVNLGDDMQWRSSRDPKRCDEVRQDAAQDIRGSTRTYGCVYKTARLLYTVTYIPNPKPATPPPKTK